MTYDMTTPIGPVNPNEWTCRRAHGNTQNHPKHSKPRDRLAKEKENPSRYGVLCLNTVVLKANVCHTV